MKYSISFFAVFALLVSTAAAPTGHEGHSGKGVANTKPGQKADAKTFVHNIPDHKLVGAGDAGPQKTIHSVDGKGNDAKGGKPKDGHRLDKQKPPGESSPWQSQLQVQQNGPSKPGQSTTVGGVLIPQGHNTPPKTIKSKLTHSINTGKMEPVHKPGTDEHNQAIKNKKTHKRRSQDLLELLARSIVNELD